MWRASRPTPRAPSIVEMQRNEEPPFSLSGEVHRIQLAPSDNVTAVAATGATLWIGTANGRLIRYDSATGNWEEVRGRLGVGKLDNAVWKIFADGVSRGAVVVLKNVDGYHVSGKGAVRPRWLSKLRGLRVVSGHWTRVKEGGVILLGTEFGALFSLVIDEKNEREDVLNKLWATEEKVPIEGIRVEYIGARWVGVVVTKTKMYVFANAERLEGLFVDDRIVAQLERGIDTDVDGVYGIDFMSGNGVGGRRFVWGCQGGVAYGQLMVRRNRRGGVLASLQDVDMISWERLRDTSGDAQVVGLNLSAFHCLVVYPGSVFAYNQLSGQLTQRVGVWKPTKETGREGKRGLGWEEGSTNGKVLQHAVGGICRDLVMDLVWLWTEGGEIVRFKGGSGEIREAYVAAKAGGRFDVAMALAPVVGGGEVVGMQSREAVLEARADYAARDGQWNIAADLYAKTNRGVENVLLGLKGESEAEEEEGLKGLGSGDRVGRVKVMIWYLIRKLDRVEGAMQRGILAMMVVQMYAMLLGNGEDVRDDFEGFLVDRWKDLDVRSAVGVLLRNGCRREAVKLGLLGGEVCLAAEVAARGGVEEGLEVLRDERVATDKDLRGRVIERLGELIEKDPERVGNVLGRVLRRGGGWLFVVRELSRVSRGGAEGGYEAATSFLYQILGNAGEEWGKLVLVLFQLHGEFGTEAEAQKSYEHLLREKVREGMTEELKMILGGVLQSAASAGFSKLCVHLYWDLEMYRAAIQLGVEVDVQLAEQMVGSLKSVSERKMLWRLVAEKSDDAVGVVERSRGVLHIEDVLPGMGAFEAASDRVKVAVGGSLEEHQRGAQRATAEVVGALEVIRCLKEDLERVDGGVGCGHRRKKRGGDCRLCGWEAVESIERLFEQGHELEIGAQVVEHQHGTADNDDDDENIY